MSKVRAWWGRQQFFPSGIGILLHPSFLIRRRLAKAISEEAPAFEGRVLDFGCGSKPYREVFVSASDYIGVDVEMSGHDHQRLNSAVDVFYDGLTLPFSDEEFDGVVAFEVFEHVFTPDDVIGELRRVLKPGGKVMATTPFAWPEHEEPYDFARYSTFGMRSIFERNGFEVEEVRRIGNGTETAFQLLSNVVAQRTGNSQRFLRLAAQVGLVFPLNLIGVILGRFTGDNMRLYSNNLLLATRAT